MEAVRCDQQIFDKAPPHEVLLDDSFEGWRIAEAIPRTFRIDDDDWSALANPEAIGLRPKNAALF